MKYRRRMTWAEGVKRATVEPKSKHVVDEVEAQMRREGVSETRIAEILDQVNVLPPEDEALLH